MPQREIAYYQERAFEGMRGSFVDQQIRGTLQEYINADTQNIFYGAGVVRGLRANEILLPSAAGQVIIGVVPLKDQHGVNIEELIKDTVRPGVPPKYPIPVLTSGDIWVWSETPTNIDDPVYCRGVAAAAPNNRRGRWRSTPDGTNTIAFPRARFITSTTGAGLAVINIGGF